MHSLIGRLLDLSIGYSLIIHPELKLSSLIVHKKQVFLPHHICMTVCFSLSTEMTFLRLQIDTLLRNIKASAKLHSKLKKVSV